MAAPAGPPEGSLSYRPGHELNLGFALMGTKTVTRRSGVYWWSTTTPLGSAVVAFRPARAEIRADAWGPGTDWALTRLPSLLGADDDPTGFRPDHPVVAALATRFGTLRIGATGRWYEALATSAIGQRVVKGDATTSRMKLSRRHGDLSLDAPVPPFPTPSAILSLTDHEFHRAGIERSRARVVRIAARYADRLEALDDVSVIDATSWLQRLPGVGPWTTALTTSVAGGDPDAVPIGDLHIPRKVTYALSGEEGDDQRMLELLEPFAGHRQRVVRLVKMSDAGPANHRPAPFRHDISRI